MASNMFRVDPIEDPTFNPMRWRPANPDRMARIRTFADAYRTARQLLEEEIREAKTAGHSFPQLAEASGLSISSIQRIVASPTTPSVDQESQQTNQTNLNEQN